MVFVESDLQPHSSADDEFQAYPLCELSLNGVCEVGLLCTDSSIAAPLALLSLLDVTV